MPTRSKTEFFVWYTLVDRLRTNCYQDLAELRRLFDQQILSESYI